MGPGVGTGGGADVIRSMSHLSRVAIDEGIANVNALDRYGWKLCGLSRDSVSVRWNKDGSEFEIVFHAVGREVWFECDLGNRFIDSKPIVTIGDEDWCDEKTLDEGFRAMMSLVARIVRAKERRG